MSTLVTMSLPLSKPLPSAANLREHWATKAKRVKAQRVYVGILLRQHERQLRALGWPAVAGRMHVTLSRVAPRKLDDDNLAHAFKAIRDEVAKHFGVDDGSPRWAWRYTQQRGAPAIDIDFELQPMASDVEVDPSDWERP